MTTATEVYFRCVCGAGLSASEESKGRPGECPRCRRVVAVPEDALVLSGPPDSTEVEAAIDALEPVEAEAPAPAPAPEPEPEPAPAPAKASMPAIKPDTFTTVQQAKAPAPAALAKARALKAQAAAPAAEPPAEAPAAEPQQEMSDVDFLAAGAAPEPAPAEAPAPAPPEDAQDLFDQLTAVPAETAGEPPAEEPVEEPAAAIPAAEEPAPESEPEPVAAEPEPLPEVAPIELDAATAGAEPPAAEAVDQAPGAEAADEALPPAEKPEFTPLPADSDEPLPMPEDAPPAEPAEAAPEAEAGGKPKGKRIVVRRLKKKSAVADGEETAPAEAAAAVGETPAEPAPSDTDPGAPPAGRPVGTYKPPEDGAREEESENAKLGRALRRAGMRSDREPVEPRKPLAARAAAGAKAKPGKKAEAAAAAAAPAPAMTCSKCKEQIPEGEEVCPGCGASRPKKRRTWLWVLMPTLVLILALFGTAVFSPLLDPLVDKAPAVKDFVGKCREFCADKGWIKLPPPPPPADGK